MRINRLFTLVILLSVNASVVRGLYIRNFKLKEIKTLISEHLKGPALLGKKTAAAGLEKPEKIIPIEYPVDYSCKEDQECQHILEGSICWKAKCICADEKPIHLHKPAKCVKVSALHEDCEYDEQCTVAVLNSNYYCKKSNVSSTCACKPGYTETIDHNKCVAGYYLGSKCTTPQQCLGFTNFSICALSSNFKICQCISGYVRRGHKCQPQLDADISTEDDASRESYLLKASIGTCSVIAFIGVTIFICSIKTRFKKKAAAKNIKEEELEAYQRKEEKLQKIENQKTEADAQEKLAKAKKIKEEELARSEAETRQILKSQKKLNKKVNAYCPMKDENACQLVKVSKSDMSHHPHPHEHKHGNSHKKRNQEEIHGIDNENYQP